jgi:sortase A
MTAGLVVLLFVVYELVGTNLTEEHSQGQLAKAFNAAVAAARPAPTSATTAPATKSPGHRGTSSRHTKGSSRAPTAALPGAALPVPPPGGALDHMVIPAIGVDRYVVEGVAELDLQMGPGHYPGTPLPGQDGNVGIAGHRTTFGAPFFRLNELVPGDFIYLTDTSGTTWVYDVVRQWVVLPSDTAVLDASHLPELTLTTCNPRFEATTRLVVRAELVKRLSRGTRLTGDLPVSARRTATATAAKHEKTTLGTVPPTAAARPASTVPATTGYTAVPRTSTTVLSETGQGPGGRGADSPTVGSVAASASGGGAWGGALGWGALALVAWALTRIIASRRYRYAKLGVLACGALLCLVPLWFSFSNVVDLLPANL